MTQLFDDNRSAIAIVRNPTMHGCTKYIDIRFHFIKGLISNGVVNMEYYGTNEQLVDVKTKALLVQ